VNDKKIRNGGGCDTIGAEKERLKTIIDKKLQDRLPGGGNCLEMRGQGDRNNEKPLIPLKQADTGRVH